MRLKTWNDCNEEINPRPSLIVSTHHPQKWGISTRMLMSCQHDWAPLNSGVFSYHSARPKLHGETSDRTQLFHAKVFPVGKSNRIPNCVAMVFPICYIKYIWYQPQVAMTWKHRTSTENQQKHWSITICIHLQSLFRRPRKQLSATRTSSSSCHGSLDLWDLETWLTGNEHKTWQHYNNVEPPVMLDGL